VDPRRIFAIGIRAIIAGVILGVGGRLAMRAIGMAAGAPTAFSLGGSLEVVAFGALVGIPVAIVFLLARARSRTAAWWPGILIGLLVLLAFVILPPGPARGAFASTRVTPIMVFGPFVVLFAAYGLTLELMHRWRSSS
jgi:hypothetical protein